MKKNLTPTLALAGALAWFPGVGMGQTVQLASRNAEGAASAGRPPFCYVCRQFWHDPCQSEVPFCVNDVQFGWHDCESWFGDCSSYGCFVQDEGCVYNGFATDGSVRMFDTHGLSHDAIAAIVGAPSSNASMLNRPCDGAVVARQVDAALGIKLRRATARIVL